MKYILFLFFPLFGHAQSSFLKYQWRKISGPAQYTIESPDAATTHVTNLVAGVYQFELKVTNSANLSARDTMTVTVNPAKTSYISKWTNIIEQNISLTATGNHR